MTFWLDAQIDPKLAEWLGANFNVIAKSVDELALRFAKDPQLFDAARRLGPVVIVTKDYDFVELVTRHGAPPQILWLSCGNMGTLRLQVKLRQSFPIALQLLEAGDALVEIA